MVAWEWLPFATADPLHRGAVDRPRSAGGRAHGRGRTNRDLPPHRDAAPGPLDQRGGHDRDDLPAGIFAEIYVTAAGGPGDSSTNLAFLIYKRPSSISTSGGHLPPAVRRRARQHRGGVPAAQRWRGGSTYEKSRGKGKHAGQGDGRDSVLGRGSADGSSRSSGCCSPASRPRCRRCRRRRCYSSGPTLQNYRRETSSLRRIISTSR